MCIACIPCKIPQIIIIPLLIWPWILWYLIIMQSDYNSMSSWDAIFVVVVAGLYLWYSSVEHFHREVSRRRRRCQSISRCGCECFVCACAFLQQFASIFFSLSCCCCSLLILFIRVFLLPFPYTDTQRQHLPFTCDTMQFAVVHRLVHFFVVVVVVLAARPLL